MAWTSRPGLHLLTALALTACGGEVSSVPADPLASALARPGAAAVQQSLTGHAEFINPVSGSWLKMSVNAIRHPDGRVTGKVEQHVEIAATGEFVRKAHSTVLCVTVVGNMARYGAVIDRIEGVGAPPGTEIVGTAVDNGEDGTAPPDLASPTAPGSAAVHCATGLAAPPPLFAVEKGNIQVRP